MGAITSEARHSGELLHPHRRAIPAGVTTGLCILPILIMMLIQFSLLLGTNPAAFHGRLMEQYTAEVGPARTFDVLWVSGDNGAALASVIPDDSPAAHQRRLWVAKPSGGGSLPASALALWYGAVFRMTPIVAVVVSLLLFVASSCWILRGLMGEAKASNNARSRLPITALLLILAILSALSATRLHAPVGIHRGLVVAAWFLSIQGLYNLLAGTMHRMVNCAQ